MDEGVKQLILWKLTWMTRILLTVEVVFQPWFLYCRLFSSFAHSHSPYVFASKWSRYEIIVSLKPSQGLLIRKPWHTSSFLLERTDFKNVIFEKIPWAPSEVAEVANFGFHLIFMSFHLVISSLWVSRLFDRGDLGVLRMGAVNFFKNYIFEISAF